MLVAVAVLASSLVFAGGSSAHKVEPVYSCEEGEPDAENQCAVTVEATAEYSCATGDLVGTECVIDTGEVPAASCASGRLAGDICLHVANPISWCPVGKLTDDGCEHSVDAAEPCASGRLAGDICLHVANPISWCPVGKLTDDGCEHSVDAAEPCASGRPAGDICLHVANPISWCPVGKLTDDGCEHSVDAAEPCASGRPAGDICLHAADPVYRCSSGTLSGSRCLHTAPTVYRCSSGTLRGTSCVTSTTAPAAASCSSGSLSGGRCLHVTTADPGCPRGYQAGPFDTCYKYTSPAYRCASGTLRGASCVTTTAAPATAGCPAGYQAGAFGICYRYTAANASCPADYDPPSVGICFKRTPATPPCSAGYTHTAGKCTRITVVSSRCPADYDPPAAGLCFKRTPATPPCSAGYTHTAGKCTRITVVSSRCPADYDPPAAGLCFKRTPAEYTCTTGTPKGAKCTTTTPATVKYTCPTGTPDANNECTTTAPATLTCDGEETTDPACPHPHPDPTIDGLDATGTSVAGTAYTDDFTVTPTDTPVTTTDTGCSVAGTDGSYTLTATRPDPGTLTCTITATTATATAAIDFTNPPATLRAPTGLACTWPTQANGQVECSWHPVTGATRGYTVEYEMTLNLRGNIRTVARDRDVSGTKFSIGTNKYLTQTRLRVAAIGPDATGPYTAWATATKPGPAPRNLGVECRADAKVYVSWDAVARASAYTATITSTPPRAQVSAPRKLTENLEPPNSHSNPPTSFDFDGQANWSYEVQLTAEVSGTASLPATASTTCTPVAPPAPADVTAACSNGVLTVTWNPAGTGLSKATSHKPRIFTGESTTPDTRWTANAAGHDTTTATIPAPGEPDLPETDIFQVKVKATNTAGDSDWSDPVKATCGPPGPIEDLKCTAITKDQITIEWNTAVGAQNYTLIIAPTPTGTSQPPLSIAALQQEKQSYTFEGLYSSHLHRIAVQPTNTKLGPTATLECTTLDNDWLEVECSSTRVLDVEWNNPPDASLNYTVKISSPQEPPAATAVRLFAASGTNAATRWVTPGPIEQTFVQRKFERRYSVHIESSGASGPVYSQTVTDKCPNPSKPDWNTPNDDYDDPGLKWTWGINLPGWLSWPGDKLHDLLVGNQNPLLLPESRKCRVPTAQELLLDADLDRVCEESWSESMNLRLDAVLDWRDVDIIGAWDVSTNEGIVTSGEALADAAKSIDESLRNGKALRVAVRKAIGGIVVSEAVFYLKNASQNQVWARISPEEDCMNFEQLAYDQDTGWVAITTRVTEAENIGGYKTKTVASIEYCTNNPPSSGTD